MLLLVFRNWLLLIYTLFRLVYLKNTLFTKSKKHTQKIITQLHDLNDGTITKGVFLKCRDYGLEALFAGRIIADLLQHHLNQKQEEILSKSGLILAIGDVMSDRINSDEESIIHLVNNPENHINKDVLEHALSTILMDLNSIIPLAHRNSFNVELMKGLKIEQEHRKSNLEFSDSKKYELLSEQKGGQSLLIYLSLMNLDLSINQKEAISKTGALIDFIDDVFDLKWDYRDGIHTSGTVQKNWDDLMQRMKILQTKADDSLRESFYRQFSTLQFRFLFFFLSIGAEAYIDLMRDKTNNKMDSNTMQNLSEKDIHFDYFTLRNLKYFYHNIGRFRA